MTPLKIGIKYCGHCNPETNMKEIFENLKINMKGTEFCYFASSQDVDVLIILNACRVGCASRPNFDGRIITVTPDEVDYWTVPKENLVEEIIKKLRNEEYK